MQLREKGEELPCSIIACSPEGSWDLSPSKKRWADCGCWLWGVVSCWHGSWVLIQCWQKPSSAPTEVQSSITSQWVHNDGRRLFLLAVDKEACEAFWGSEEKKHHLITPSVSLRWSSASHNLVWGVNEIPRWAGRELCRAPVSGSRERMGGQDVRWEVPRTARVRVTLLPSCAAERRKLPVWISRFQNLWLAF